MTYPKTPETPKAGLSAVVTDLAPFDLLSLAEEEVRRWAGAARDKGLKLRIRFAAGTPKHLVGDAGRLRQALSILLENAVKFTRRGRVVVVVEGDRVRRGTAAVRLRVEDSGVGILQADLQELFHRSGRGLALCKQLVEGMGGRLEALSVPGKGSVFWLSLTLPLDSSRGRRLDRNAIMSGP